MDKLKYVLLVDDDEIANHLHKLLIEDLDVAEHIDIATDGEEALQIINEKVDAAASTDFAMLALIDINMPGMDAFEFLNEYQAFDQNIRAKIHIVLLSSSSNPKDKEKAGRYSISGYMLKPLTEDKLMEVINNM